MNRNTILPVYEIIKAGKRKNTDLLAGHHDVGILFSRVAVQGGASIFLPGLDN